MKKVVEKETLKKDKSGKKGNEEVNRGHFKPVYVPRLKLHEMGIEETFCMNKDADLKQQNLAE